MEENKENLESESNFEERDGTRLSGVQQLQVLASRSGYELRGEV